VALTPSSSATDQAATAGVNASLPVRLTWLAALSFASGFPFGLVNETLPVYLRTHGAGLVEIGLISAVSFPWTFKFIWAPLVDRVGSRRQWIVGCLGGLTLLTLVLGTTELAELAR
jgi:MFS transporter, PAT family, beta-lactamase induction signal transducer AmpG